MLRLLSNQNPILKNFISCMLNSYTFEYKIAQKYCWASRGFDSWEMKEEPLVIREFLSICKSEGLEIKIITRNEKYCESNLEKVITLK